MIRFDVELLPEADDHIRMYLKAGNKTAYKKIKDFLVELEGHHNREQATRTIET